MANVWNSYRNEESSGNYMSEGDPFQRYVEGMREFRLTHVETEPVAAEARGSLLTLLNLIPIYGMVVLPKNSQN